MPRALKNTFRWQQGCTSDHASTMVRATRETELQRERNSYHVRAVLLGSCQVSSRAHGKLLGPLLALKLSPSSCRTRHGQNMLTGAPCCQRNAILRDRALRNRPLPRKGLLFLHSRALQLVYACAQYSEQHRVQLNPMWSLCCRCYACSFATKKSKLKGTEWRQKTPHP